MWSYYGAKTNIIDYYPAPKFDKIIEPFAGTARYALKYFDRNVLIVDKYEVIINIWKWLQQCSPKDIDKLPRLKYGESIEDYNFDCIEAKNLVGFTIGFMTAEPRKTGTIRLQQRPNHANNMLKNISSQLWKIKHWKIENKSYDKIKNINATWFIDPPYTKGGNHYKHSFINYESLRKWCLNRKGQIIVCEANNANWLDFKQFRKHKTRTGWQKELIYTNYKSEFDHKQLNLF